MKNKIIAAAFILVLIFSGCTNGNETDAVSGPQESAAVTYSEESVSDSFEEKLNNIGFSLISNQFVRNVIQDDTEIMEMFALEKNSFIRTAVNGFEQEVYAYNYISDDFTYLYYVEDELVAKTVYNVQTGEVLQDDAGYSALLVTEAEALKQYFYDLLKEAQLTVDELG